MKILGIMLAVLVLTAHNSHATEPCSQSAKETLLTLSGWVANFSRLDGLLNAEHEGAPYNMNVVSQGEICVELGKRDSEVASLQIAAEFSVNCFKTPYSEINAFRNALRNTSDRYCNTNGNVFGDKIDRATAIASLTDIKLKARTLDEAIHSSQNP